MPPDGPVRAACTQAAVGPYRAVLDAYGGDLLPEDGPAEWVSGRRDRARAEVVEAARGLRRAPASHATRGRRRGVRRRARRRSCTTTRCGGSSSRRASGPATRPRRPAARSGYARMLAELGVAAADARLTQRQGAADGDAAACRLPKNSISVIATGAFAVAERYTDRTVRRTWAAAFAPTSKDCGSAWSLSS